MGELLRAGRGLECGSAGQEKRLRDHFDKRRVVVAYPRLVHARRNDPFLQDVIGRRAQQRVGAFGRESAASIRKLCYFREIHFGINPLLTLFQNE
jgi:hypothetical protein